MLAYFLYDKQVTWKWKINTNKCKKKIINRQLWITCEKNMTVLSYSQSYPHYPHGVDKNKEKNV